MNSGTQPENRQALADKIRNQHLHGNGRRGLWRKAAILGGTVVLCGAALWVQLNTAHAKDDVTDAPRNATAEFGFRADVAEGAGQSPTPVVIYEDFLCSSCSLFHAETAQYLSEQVASGSITLEYRPFAFLISASSNEYSQRAANAAACVGDLGGVAAFVAMHDTLLEHQPEHGAAGPSDEQLIEFAKAAGAKDPSNCITERKFDAWVSRALDAAVASGIKVTPTIRVDNLEVVRAENGQESMPGLAELQYALEQVAK